MGNAPKWQSVTAVAPESRRTFLDLVVASAFTTRAQLFAEDKIDSEALGLMTAEYITRFWEERGSDNVPNLEDEFQRGLNALPSEAPVRREETENKELDGWLWDLIGRDDSFWDSGSRVVQGGRFFAIYSGLEYDAPAAARFGIKTRCGTGEVETASAPRRLRGNWPDWISSAVWLGANGELNGSLTQTALLKIIADDMAARNMEEMARATVQPAADAILARLRTEGIFS